MRTSYFVWGAAVILIGIGIWIGVNGMSDKETPISDTSPFVDDYRVQVIEHDGYPVAYQNGFPIPSFTTWKMDEESRAYQSLHGEWAFMHDEHTECASEVECSSSEYDDSGWAVQNVPASLDFSYEDGAYEKTFGSFWFRKTVEVDEAWGNQFIKLVSLGMGPRADVYVNGHKVGATESGTTPFALNVTPFIHPGEENVIAVHVERRLHTSTDRDSLPPGAYDWWDYTGITRDIFLEATSPHTVSKVNVQASKQDSTVQAQAVVLNLAEEDSEMKVKLDPGIDGVESESKQVTIEANSVRVVPFEFHAPQIEAWSADDPNLYTMKAEIPGKDALSVQYGAVDVEVDGTDIRINGEPVFLKGTNWHEESAISGRSMAVEEYQRELDVMKAADANFIRNAHYNRHPYAYEYANEIGLYVMDEIENYWMDQSHIRHQVNDGTLSEELAIAMAWNQGNHPSVIIWNVANENNSNNTDHVAFFNMLRDAVRQVDAKQRPVTYASNTQHHPQDMTRAESDIVTINQYYGFHGGNSEDFGAGDFEVKLEELHERYPQKPIIITENGTWSSYGNRGRATEGGTEDWQAANFAAHWDVTVSKPYTAGYTHWNFKDYRSKEEYTEGNISRLSTMGLVDWYELRPKVVYEYFQNATLSGANRVLNPNFESEIDSWQVEASNEAWQDAMAFTADGLALELHAEETVELRQSTFDLLAGEYEFSVMIQGIGDGINGELRVNAATMDETVSVPFHTDDGRVTVPFSLSHTGSSFARFSIHIESDANDQPVTIGDVQLRRVVADR